MAVAKRISSFNKYLSETGTQTISGPSGTYEHRISIAPNQVHGILTASVNGTGFIIKLGGVYFFTTQGNDAVGRSTTFIQDTISSGSGTGAGTYTYYYSRPEIFNKQDDSQVGSVSYGRSRVPNVLIDQLYIDTSTDEIVVVFATSLSSGSATFEVELNATTYQVVNG